MTNSKKKGFKPLRRPLAPPSPPQQPLQHLPKSRARSKYITGPSLRSQSLPSLVDSNEERASPVPSNAPSLASDIGDTVHNAPQNTPWTKHGASSQGHYQESIGGTMDPSDWRFILESKYKIKWDKHGGTRTMETNSLVKPYKPRGPDAFPLREPLKPPEVLNEFVYADANHPRYHDYPEFALDDFLLQNPLYGYSRAKLKTILFSKQNYKKLTTLFATFLDKPTQEKVNTVELKGEDIPEVEPRVPQHQVLLEMASIIRQQMRSLVTEELTDQVPGMSGRLGDGGAPSLVSGVMKSLPPLSRETGVSGKENLFSAPPSKYFQGSVRSQEPFEESDSAATITPSELAVLDCLVNGGQALSLKAHFIASLPEVSPLNRTITYLNLSFNDFRHFPLEVLQFRNLEILKLRNNPLKELPQDINKLVKLRTLVLSFCLINTLPINLFQLPLEYLDLSYNKLSFLPNEMKQLRYLRFLNLEGNQLAALPCSFLKLKNLKSLRVYNNFMHPLFWRENSQNIPQRLSDLALLICKQEDIDNRVVIPSSELRRALDSYTICECCHGPLFGPGLRIIRPCSRAFGVAHLPFFFTACSPQCRDSFMQNVESISAIIYGDHG